MPPSRCLRNSGSVKLASVCPNAVYQTRPLPTRLHHVFGEVLGGEPSGIFGRIHLETVLGAEQLDGGDAVGDRGMPIHERFREDQNFEVSGRRPGLGGSCGGQREEDWEEPKHVGGISHVCSMAGRRCYSRILVCRRLGLRAWQGSGVWISSLGRWEARARWRASESNTVRPAPTKESDD